MKNLIFSGSRKMYRTWSYEFALMYEEVKGEEVLVYPYLHWEEEGVDLINYKRELDRIPEMLDYENDKIIAFSSGNMLLLNAFNDGIIDSNSSSFVGLPYYWLVHNNYEVDGLLGGLRNDMVKKFFQNSDDPLMSAADLTRKILELRMINAQLIEFEGYKHDYFDINKWMELL